MRRERGERLYPYLLVAPVIAIVGLGVVLGLGYLLILSSQRYSLIRLNDIQFIGLENYARVFEDRDFWRSVTASFIWVIGSVVPQFVLGLGLALILNQNFRGRGIFRVLTIMPWAVSGVVAGLMWLWVFDGTIGVLNDLLMKAGLTERPIPWTLFPETTWFTLFVANAWRGTPFFAIMFLAALQGIDDSLYEAAKIDGASAWQRFLRVTLPLIKQTIIISTMLRVIWTFNYIDLIFTMTEGGPLSATRTLAMYIFDTAYVDSDFGYAAALAVITCLILTVFSVIYWKLGGAEEAQDS
ncbi:MAG TPA: sugar ABC transporter permease [Aggregatilineales bacterium]|nr:sugar ABC transporter permease [Aggregatilineales bacterium]